MPITWRNVDAPNFGAANELLNQGANRLTSSLTGIGSQLDARVDRQKDVWDQTREANTENYLGQISSATDLDAIAQLRASLTPEYMKENYGNQVNLRAVNEALQNQGRFVRQDAKEQIEHDNLLMDQSSRDLRGQIQAAYAVGDFATGDRLKQEALAAGQIHGDHFADLLQTRTNRADRLFDQSLAQQRVNMDARRLQMQEIEHRDTQRRLREAKDQDQRINSISESAMRYAFEFGNTEEGRAAFLEMVKELPGITGTEKMNAPQLWNKALAQMNDVPEDVQIKMSDAGKGAIAEWQKQSGIDLAAERRELERLETRFVSGSDAPYMAAYQEGEALLSDARQRIIDSQDHKWWDGERAAAENVIADMERIRANVTNAIKSDPKLAGQLSPFGDKIPDGVMALAMSKTSVSRNSTSAPRDFSRVLQQELENFIATQNAFSNFQQRRDNFETAEQEAERIRREAEGAVKTAHRINVHGLVYGE